MRKIKTKRLVFDALLTAIALIIFTIELHLPSLTPIPGVKLGLSNIITLVALFLYGPWDALVILLMRIFLGCLFSGNMMALAYSLTGGLFSYLLLLVLRKIISPKQIFVASVLCGMAHNVGQVLVAVLITHTPAVWYYLPILCISGIIAGLFTGLCAQFTLPYLKKTTL